LKARHIFEVSQSGRVTTVGVYTDILVLQTLFFKMFIISAMHSGSANSSVAL